MPGGRHDPGLQERFDQRQNPLVLDPMPYPFHQRRVPDFIETRLDVGFQHPLMRVTGQKMDLGDCVLGSAVRSKPIRARFEIRLKKGVPTPP